MLGPSSELSLGGSGLKNCGFLSPNSSAVAHGPVRRECQVLSPLSRNGLQLCIKLGPLPWALNCAPQGPAGQEPCAAWNPTSQSGTREVQSKTLSPGTTVHLRMGE